ncbi:uncharacterized protein C9orf50 homolog [Lagenorhynchus albirostris]|uniref:uncharacterized protein C9orf50 homolog n=1 Tax=Lagenorhynchus albirostris TaxID=27610 RepID=UPI0028F12163|nr:uncharacterized protein C9orf50 homolog [Lagenorhynchus albirostris]
MNSRSSLEERDKQKHVETCQSPRMQMWHRRTAPKPATQQCSHSGELSESGPVPLRKDSTKAGHTACSHSGELSEWRPRGSPAVAIADGETRCCRGCCCPSSEQPLARGPPGVPGLRRAAPSGGRPPRVSPRPRIPGWASGAPGRACPSCPPWPSGRPGTDQGLRSLLLPPTLLAGEPGEPAPRAWTVRGSPQGLGQGEPRLFGRPPRRAPPRPVPAVPGSGSESAKQPRPPTSSPSQHQRGVSEHSGSPPQCPRDSFLPDLGPHTTQAPKLKAVLTHNSSGEGSGHRRRCCPFRVQFADETLRYTALRYWERSCAVLQGILENRTASGSAASEQVFGSVGRWLESLPKALYPRAKEDTTANSFGWDFRGLSTLEPKDHLSEDTSLNSSLPFIPRPTT